jgi:hypothetical protein
LLAGRRDYARARRLLEEALPHHRAALKAYPRHPLYRAFLRNNPQILAGVLVHLGAYTEAAAAADRLAAAGSTPAADLYNAACFLSLCAPLAQKDAMLSESRRKDLARQYGDRAIALLRQAVAKGYKDAAHMKQDTDLDPLRGREDFKKLMAELEHAKPNGK